MAHIPGVENVVADTLSRQFDDAEEMAVVHVHSLADVDLAALARDQRSISEEQSSSLRLEKVCFPGLDSTVVCDTSLGRPCVLVPESRR